MIGKRVLAICERSIGRERFEMHEKSKEYGFTISDEEIMVRIMLNHMK
jgi:hypothetical protein